MSEIVFYLDLPDREMPLEVRVANRADKLNQFSTILRVVALEADQLRAKLYPIEDPSPQGTRLSQGS